MGLTSDVQRSLRWKFNTSLDNKFVLSLYISDIGTLTPIFGVTNQAVLSVVNFCKQSF